MNDIRVRIAPSPTGPLHVGTARTALYNYLFAKQHAGAFILRIEDTDAERSTKEFEQNILDGLHWLGLQWDEGPDIGGHYAPYRQSERKKMYADALHRLLEKGSVYLCYCTKEDLERQRSEQQQRGATPVYSGTCRDLSDQQRKQYEEEGRRPIFRFRTPSQQLQFHDLIRGEVTFNTNHIGDFSVARSANDPLYNLAVVVDDAEMNISHVIRGEDGLSNTPKQLLLYSALGYKAPEFGHIPLLLSTNRAKLSKRDSVTSIDQYKNMGFLPEALVNYLALLGWNPGDEREHFTLQELTTAFSLDRVHKGGAVFDQQKLEHMNGVYIRQLPSVEVINRAGESLREARQQLGDHCEQAVSLVQDRLVTLTELPDAVKFLYEAPEYDAALLIPKKGDQTTTVTVLSKFRKKFGSMEQLPNMEELHDQALQWVKEWGMTNQQALWPLRVALSGQQKSPGVFEIAAVLGVPSVTQRLDLAIQKIEALQKA